MAEYNGHKNWTHWNVALWIGNDEGLYALALACLKRAKSRTSAARRFTREVGTMKTPDGARWSIVAVAAALEGLT